ncbi:MAG: pilus assembly protein [Bdellovibrionales bacterium]|nr:pilus assembly protein [Bdellovibrionales bacterium]
MIMQIKKQPKISGSKIGRSRLRNNLKGAVLVEAAIVIPIVFLVLSIGLNLGLIADNLEQANESVGEGVRYGVALSHTSTATESDVKNAVEIRIIDNFASACFSCTSIDVDAAFSDFSSGGVTGRRLRADLTFNYNILGLPIPGVNTISMGESQAVFYSAN